MDARLRQALQRAEEVGQALADPAVARDSSKLQAFGREHARLAPIVRLAERLTRLQHELHQARELVADGDAELAALARADIEHITPEVATLSEQLEDLL